jgi:hypothetical protein
MNNYTEHTWTLVTISEAIKDLMKTYIQYPPRKLQSMGRGRQGAAHARTRNRTTLEVRISPLQLPEQLLRFDQVGTCGLGAEPAADITEQLARLCGATGRAPEARQTDRRPQLERPGL